MATIAKKPVGYGNMPYVVRILLSLALGLLIFQAGSWFFNNLLFDWPGSDFHSVTRTNGLVTSFAFTPDGKQLATGSILGTDMLRPGAQVFSFPEGKLLRTFGTGSVWTLALSPDGQFLATRSSDNYTVNLWRVSNGQIVRSFVPSKDDWVSKMAFSPDGKILATGAYDKVLLWRVSDFSLLTTLKTDTYSIIFSPDSKLLITGGAAEVAIWSLSDGKLLHKMPGHGISIGMSPDGQWLAIPESATSSNVQLWRIADAKLIRTLEPTGPQTEIRQIHSLAVSPDGEEVATGNIDSHVYVWRASDGTLLHQFDTACGSGESISFTPDGRSLVVGCNDRVKVSSLELP